MAIALPHRFNWQPQTTGARVDNATVLGRILEHVHVPGADAGPGIRTDRKRNINLVPSSTAFGYSYRAQGVHMAGTGAASQTTVGTLAAGDRYTTYPVVHVGAGYFNSAGDNYAIGEMYASGGGGGSSCRCRLTGASSLEYRFRTNFGTATALTATVTGLSAGKFICFVAQTLSATDHRLYVNGIMYTAATNVGAMADTIDKITVGSAGGGFNPLNGGVLFFGCGRTAFPDDLALNLSANPGVFWNIFPQYHAPILFQAAADAITIPALGYAE